MLILVAVALKANGQPVNDNFADRSIIIENMPLGRNSFAGAQSESGERLIPGVSSGQSSWWTRTAPPNGIATISATATGFSPLLTVYIGADLTSLSLVASNNYLACYDSHACGCHWRVRTRTTFHATRGQSYQVALDSAIITRRAHCFTIVSLLYQRQRSHIFARSMRTCIYYEHPNRWQCASGTAIHARACRRRF